MYASCGDMRYASFLFDKMPNLTVFALNWMILASAFNGNHEEAIGYFSLMRESISFYNKFTFSVVLKACVGLVDVNKGKEVHGIVYQLGLNGDVYVANDLVNMYCKCGMVNYARKVFDEMGVRDVVSWTSMICGYINIEKIEEAHDLFKNMKLDGLEPNGFTWNAMIAGYARRGDSNEAIALFTGMTREGLVPDLVTWNAIISGFAQSHRASEALKLFRDMIVSGIKPNHVTFTGLLPVCRLTGWLHIGREIHGMIYRTGLGYNVFVTSAIIDMYSKCGCEKDARNIFDTVPVKNFASWNAMIGCYGNHGMVDSSIQLFERMQKEGIQANEVTLISILSACSHGGYVEKGLKIFKSMKERYGIEAREAHYACVVDMLCRSGRVVEAYEFVKEMPIEVTESIVGAFFNGCKVHGRSDLAKMMAGILRMELKRPGGFVTLSNIYAADREWDQVENVRKLMKEKNVLKQPGFSWVEKVAELEST
ncbi:PPR domain-containing protein/PPR_1 domain-containing protein/PPR_2 domain-containing protein [Cephalotus follicularis]|uniref:PPR domain-containing protein/PPR_1 domain-containing protein/PPR_2 domain-containing protein n=1 Tax=Cephalotus follicularis TaxID=3775 RepID=A0A1Q3BEW8_CEPFO|nr:PPR domain-containing protein/PPR_1 domain-containing protein/PPR_2 domain-containing protein [Cephalotus follicularis]